ncbi:superoxide dismutase family protein [Paucibacter sp. B2R-40]|uniref:superoxide dismutase family protein n=1 Tax=Paucibacter sp. B2R-40 TaxID=2893554 RepID=UPI0021E48EFE|nr:superoxide dismutase family protein [Paucibacter sp. B2R-40]MCV2354817.1 superoxide dismutase family protein [Paucibacter sp. B2R-40]
MKNFSTSCRRLVLPAAALALSACATPETAHDKQAAGAQGTSAMAGMSAMTGMAMASLTPTQGNNVRGLVMFHEKDGHVMVHAKLSGLKANAEHGFHLHEKGDCASTDGTSAGGHFNPDGKPHGPQTADHHAGDMPALKADANGIVDQKFMLHGPTVAAGPASINGRSVIVHIAPDDYATQPTGNSGARIACGVIAAH